MEPLKLHCAYESHCILGEAPIWHPIEKVLYWVDILKPALHRLDPELSHHDEWTMPTNICCIAPLKQGGLILALRTGIAIFHAETGIHYLNHFLDQKNKLIMCNDGHCDRQGRFWVGTKDLKESNPIGEIYMLAENGAIKKQDDGYTVANGLIADLASEYFYIADSPNRVIYRYAFDAKKGCISDKEVFATIPKAAGYPDGMTIDSEGCIWGAHFNGWRLTRYTPDGKIDTVIEMPVQAPTSCCFGGRDLKTLYITSAKRDVTDNELNNQPLAGCLFEISLPVGGVSEPMFDISQIVTKE